MNKYFKGELVKSDQIARPKVWPNLIFTCSASAGQCLLRVVVVLVGKSSKVQGRSLQLFVGMFISDLLHLICTVQSIPLMEEGRMFTCGAGQCGELLLWGKNQNRAQDAALDNYILFVPKRLYLIRYNDLRDDSITIVGTKK